MIREDTPTLVPTDTATAIPSATSTGVPSETPTGVPSETPTLFPGGGGTLSRFEILSMHILEEEHVQNVQTELAAERLIKKDEIRAFAKHGADVTQLHIMMMCITGWWITLRLRLQNSRTITSRRAGLSPGKFPERLLPGCC